MEPVIFIGERGVSWGRPPGVFGFSRDDRRYHTAVFGKTGLGKTTLLRNLLVQDIAAGEGVALIDPHGDLAEELLDYIPRWRADDVVYINPADLKNPVGFNLLRQRGERHQVVAGIVSALRHLWADSWGPRLEYILANALSALVEDGSSTLLGVLRLLDDADYRERVVARVSDPLVRRFWTHEFADYSDRFRSEAIAPIQNKLGRLLSVVPIRNILGQVRSTLDVRFMMDDRRILIVNLSKGLLGEDNASFLGSLLVASIQLAAMQRGDTPEADRTDFYVYLDEAHTFTTPALAGMLSELRKYRCSLTLATQYLDQLRPEIRSAVFGNVGNLVSFGVGAADAEQLAAEFDPFPPGRLTELDRFEVAVRLREGRGGRSAFTARTLPPAGNFYGRRDAIARRSAEKYGRSREKIESKIKRWLSV
jgi:DNA helicase HerA-like ATPase